MTKCDDWAAAERVLCIRLDALGDVLMTTPSLAALKRQSPPRRLTLLTSSAGAALAPLLPMIDETIVYDPPWMKATMPRADSAIDRAMIDTISQQDFEAAVIFTVYSQSPFPAAQLAYLADIPLRLAHARENPYQLLTHWVRDPEPEQLPRHEAQRQLDLVAAIGATIEDRRLVLRVPAIARRQMRQRLANLGVRSAMPLIVIHPGASAPSRRYRADGFSAVARRLVEDHGCQVLWTGSLAEVNLVATIQKEAAVPSWSLAGQTSLEELAALLAEASLLVSNNTGPVHMAAALGTPIVDLYALTNPQHAPWQVPHELLFHDVPCRNCYRSVCPLEHHDCLRLVPPDAVVAAACRLLVHRHVGALPAVREAVPLAASLPAAG